MKHEGVSRPKVVTVGLSNRDYVWGVEAFPPQGSRTPATAYRAGGGGPAATAAVVLARLGAEVSLYSLQGDDADGMACLQELETYGVNTQNVRRLESCQTPVSAVLVTPAGERYIFPYKPDVPDTAKDLDFSTIATADCVLTDSRYPNLNEAVLKEAKANGVPIVGDFSNTDNWHLAAYAKYLIVSEECAAQVLGRAEPEAALTKLRQFEEQLVGVTLGEQGFIYEHGAGLRHVPALNVDVVDTTGAGDVFHGAYAYAVASGRDAENCGLFASVAAALSCRALGARGYLPTAAEVEELLVEKTAKEMDERSWV